MKRAINGFGTVLTVVGLAVLAYVGLSWYNQHSAQHQAQAQVQSIAWNASEQAQGRSLASRLAARARKVVLAQKTGPAPGSEQASRIIIPRIRVDAPVVDTAPTGGVWEVADWAVGHLSTTPGPGGVGNNALAAHDDIKGEIFKRLDELKPGDKIELYTPHAEYTYVVTLQEAVDPSDVSVLAASDKPIVTLISCAPYWVDTQRLVVQGILQSRRLIA